MKRYSADSLKEFSVKLLEAAGVDSKDASVMSGALVDAELMGVKTHGIARLNLYLDHLEHGNINAKPDIKIVTGTASMAVIDADRAMGPVAGDFAMKEALKKAAETGVGAVAVMNSSHLGALGVTARKATDHKMIGIVFSNTSPIMAPTGGCEPSIGNNPLAIAVPSGGDCPYVLDMALSITARGNIILAAREGRSIPEGWAVNKNGEVTTNAREALEGAVLPLAGHKGYALAFMFDVLCGVLSGAAFGRNVGSFVPPDYSKPLNMGHFVLALGVEKFMPFDIFKERLQEYIKQLKSCRKAGGFEEILVPGERSNRRYKENLEKGVEISPVTLNILNDLAKKYEIEPLS